jgi:hypothetical protein
MAQGSSLLADASKAAKAVWPFAKQVASDMLSSVLTRDTLTYMVLGGITAGAVAGAVSAAWTHAQLQPVLGPWARDWPPAVVSNDALMHPFSVMAREPFAHRAYLRRAAVALDNMISLTGTVWEASPENVLPDLTDAAFRRGHLFRRALERFYAASGILTRPTGPDVSVCMDDASPKDVAWATGDAEPVFTPLALAHRSLMDYAYMLIRSTSQQVHSKLFVQADLVAWTDWLVATNDPTPALQLDAPGASRFYDQPMEKVVQALDDDECKRARRRKSRRH